MIFRSKLSLLCDNSDSMHVNNDFNFVAEMKKKKELS